MKYKVSRLEVTPGFSVTAEGDNLSEMMNSAVLFHDGFPVDELNEDQAKAAYFKVSDVLKEHIRVQNVLSEVNKLYRCS